MYEGFKHRERRKAHYIQYLIAPHVKRVPKLSDILSFGDEKKERKRVTVAERDEVMKELENKLLM